MLINFVMTYQLLNNYNYQYKYVNKNHNDNHLKNNKQLFFQLNLKKTSSPATKTTTTIIPEFSRIINIQQIPKLKPVLCRLLANNEEKLKLSIRLDIPILIYFASNVTLSRRDDRSILVNGQFEAHLKSGIP
jgi:sortase (surface protein transpeptidase)